MTTAAPAAPAAPAPAAPDANPAAPAAPWHTSLDQESQGWVQNKKFHELPVDKAIPELVKGWRGAEQYLGVPADQLIRIPKDGDEKVMSAIYDRLGRPADAKAYEFKLPEGSKPEHTAALQGVFHKYGLSNKQASGVIADLVAMEQAELAQETEAAAAKRETEVASLKTKWGQAFEKNSHIVEGVAQTYGMSKEHLAALSKVMGPLAASEMLYKIGQSLGEDKFVSSDGGNKFGDVKSPSAAKAEIESLKNDKDFMTKLQAGNTDAKAKWDRLHQQWAG